MPSSSPASSAPRRHVPLEELPFFKGFPSAMVTALKALSREESFAAETRLLREGEEADAFYVIRDGVVTIASHEDQDITPIQTLENGDVIGWSWITPPHIWTFDAIARTDTAVLAFDAADLRALCDGEPEWGYLFMKRLVSLFAARLKHMREVWRSEHVAPPAHH